MFPVKCLYLCIVCDETLFGYKKNSNTNLYTFRNDRFVVRKLSANSLAIIRVLCEDEEF